MIDRDFLYEVWATIVKQRWRSVMTAFGVFWGVLILVLLIGAGMGMKNGLLASYKVLPANCIIASSQPTMMAYSGFDVGRTWHFSYIDIEQLWKNYHSDIRDIAILNFANDKTPVTVRSGNMMKDFVLAGEAPNTFDGFPQRLIEGRFLNDIDMAENRNVCVIGDEVAEQLFDKQSPVGKNIEIDGSIYTIVGVGKSMSENMDIGFDLTESVVIPLSLMQKSYNQGDDVHYCNIILNADTDADSFIHSAGKLLRTRHSLHPDDTSALRLMGMKKRLQQIDTVFGGVNLLIWIVGLGTLLSGLVGVTNIMLISVKERTKEIGIRVAMGAGPAAVVGQIMCESVVLTALSGTLGICLGVGILTVVNNMLGEGSGTFIHPYMPFWTGGASLIIIIVGGLLAGYIPARRALNIELVKALSEE